ncbi:MAG: YdiU family protein [Filifactor alocis]|nr:YdiU family protein [Filifactor alocis]
MERGWRLSSSYKKLPGIFYREVEGERFPKPKLLICNKELARFLEIEEEIEVLSEEEKAELFSGRSLPPGASPIAQAYAGHQFGYFTILGDGRAMLMGEQVLSTGESYDIQFKGSGRTDFSRGGDGKATLGPMLREYLISEFMAALGIPTTRSLAVVTTGERIWRGRFLPGAVLTRTAQSHIRVGTFQYAAMGERFEMEALADYTIELHHPHLKNLEAKERYRLFLREVVQKQAFLVSRWQSVGFVHGVMNTDNMSVSGETIDYGPCAFIDEYNPKTVFSSIDSQGRYRYENQPKIAEWNLERFAETLLPLLAKDEREAIGIAEAEVSKFQALYKEFWMDIMLKKLGIIESLQGDEEIVEDLLSAMEGSEADYTNSFARLTMEENGEDGRYLEGTQALFADEFFQTWRKRWKNRLLLQAEMIRRRGEDPSSAGRVMREVNPWLTARNFRVEEVLDRALKNDMEAFHRFLSVLKCPYDHDGRNERYQELSKISMKGYRTFCGT